VARRLKLSRTSPPQHGSGPRPIHASWLNQIAIYVSIVQRNVLTPNDFRCLEAAADRLENFERYFGSIARPFEWKSPALASTPQSGACVIAGSRASS
jgi:hypothetical protein